MRSRYRAFNGSPGGFHPPWKMGGRTTELRSYHRKLLPSATSNKVELLKSFSKAATILRKFSQVPTDTTICRREMGGSQGHWKATVKLRPAHTSAAKASGEL